MTKCPDWQYFLAGLNNCQAFPWWSHHHPWRTRPCPLAEWSNQNHGSPLPCCARARVSRHTHTNTNTTTLIKQCQLITSLFHSIATWVCEFSVMEVCVLILLFVCVWIIFFLTVCSLSVVSKVWSLILFLSANYRAFFVKLMPWWWCVCMFIIILNITQHEHAALALCASLNVSALSGKNINVL